jgi:NAD(P)-dependent dehydrogenase (short-subunit alcohol dehydrogenase family)
MGEVIVVGGYGRLGRACVSELSETTRVPIVVAGRSVQRAEEAALACGENVRGVYVDAADPRTMRTIVQNASALVCCAGDGATEVLALALEARVPFVGTAPGVLTRSVAEDLGARAWASQVPIILGAGAVPGIPGVLAEVLVRRLPEIVGLHIATTGPWRRTETAQSDVEAARRGQAALAGASGSRSAPRRWNFEDPIGPWPVRPAPAPDLERFAESHLVRSISYLEVEPGPMARAALRLLRRTANPGGFAAAAEARAPGKERAQVEVNGPDVLQAAATAVGVLVRALIARQVPAGMLAQREAMNPNRFLEELQKRGLKVLAG